MVKSTSPLLVDIFTYLFSHYKIRIKLVPTSQDIREMERVLRTQQCLAQRKHNTEEPETAPVNSAATLNYKASSI